MDQGIGGEEDSEDGEDDGDQEIEASQLDSVPDTGNRDLTEDVYEDQDGDDPGHGYGYGRRGKDRGHTDR